jgi:hypothetical protein
VAVGSDAAYEQLDAATLRDGLLVALALGCEVGRIAIKEVDVVRVNVDVLGQKK